jgi:hypothetical protein
MIKSDTWLIIVTISIVGTWIWTRLYKLTVIIDEMGLLEVRKQLIGSAKKSKPKHCRLYILGIPRDISEPQRRQGFHTGLIILLGRTSYTPLLAIQLSGSEPKTRRGSRQDLFVISHFRP